MSLNDSSCAPAHNTPLPLRRSPPASFKRLLDSAANGARAPEAPGHRREGGSPQFFQGLPHLVCRRGTVDLKSIPRWDVRVATMVQLDVAEDAEENLFGGLPVLDAEGGKAALDRRRWIGPSISLDQTLVLRGVADPDVEAVRQREEVRSEVTLKH